VNAILAAGCVLWRPGSGGPEVALVHRPRYDDWSFPKGKLDAGETLMRCAVREVAEETGIAARLGARLGHVTYEVPDGAKQVYYWAAQAGEGEFAANDETDELRFLDVDKAAELLSYSHDGAVLRRFTGIGAPTATIALVRHAKAGSRDKWDGDDDLRPLSKTGRDQARQLVDLLGCIGPDRMVAAPPVRCLDTIAPYADSAGMAVSSEPLLGEEHYWADPDTGLARLRGIAARPGVTAICSQGGVIPEVVGVLARAAGTNVPTDVPSRKASTWLLSFTDGRLTAADYYDSPTG
jgi:8-oxo-(d)GTP phosphatase